MMESARAEMLLLFQDPSLAESPVRVQPSRSTDRTLKVAKRVCPRRRNEKKKTNYATPIESLPIGETLANSRPDIKSRDLQHLVQLRAAVTSFVVPSVARRHIDSAIGYWIHGWHQSKNTVDYLTTHSRYLDTWKCTLLFVTCWRRLTLLFGTLSSDFVVCYFVIILFKTQWLSED